MGILPGGSLDGGHGANADPRSMATSTRVECSSLFGQLPCSCGAPEQGLAADVALRCL